LRERLRLKRLRILFEASFFFFEIRSRPKDSLSAKSKNKRAKGGKKRKKGSGFLQQLLRRRSRKPREVSGAFVVAACSIASVKIHDDKRTLWAPLSPASRPLFVFPLRPEVLSDRSSSSLRHGMGEERKEREREGRRRASKADGATMKKVSIAETA